MRNSSYGVRAASLPPADMVADCLHNRPRFFLLILLNPLARLQQNCWFIGIAAPALINALSLDTCMDLHCCVLDNIAPRSQRHSGCPLSCISGQREEDGRAREPILSLNNPSIFVTSQNSYSAPPLARIERRADEPSFSIEDYRLPAPALIPSAVRHVLVAYPGTNRLS